MTDSTALQHACQPDSGLGGMASGLNMASQATRTAQDAPVATRLSTRTRTNLQRYRDGLPVNGNALRALRDKGLI